MVRDRKVAKVFKGMSKSEREQFAQKILDSDEGTLLHLLKRQEEARQDDRTLAAVRRLADTQFQSDKTNPHARPPSSSGPRARANSEEAMRAIVGMSTGTKKRAPPSNVVREQPHFQHQLRALKIQQQQKDRQRMAQKRVKENMAEKVFMNNLVDNSAQVARERVAKLKRERELRRQELQFVQSEKDRHKQMAKEKYEDEQSLRKFLRDYMKQEKQREIEIKRDIVHSSVAKPNQYPPSSVSDYPSSQPLFYAKESDQNGDQQPLQEVPLSPRSDLSTDQLDRLIDGRSKIDDVNTDIVWDAVPGDGNVRVYQTSTQQGFVPAEVDHAERLAFRHSNNSSPIDMMAESAGYAPLAPRTLKMSKKAGRQYQKQSAKPLARGATGKGTNSAPAFRATGRIKKSVKFDQDEGDDDTTTTTTTTAAAAAVQNRYRPSTGGQTSSAAAITERNLRRPHTSAGHRGQASVLGGGFQAARPVTASGARQPDQPVPPAKRPGSRAKRSIRSAGSGRRIGVAGKEGGRDAPAVIPEALRELLGHMNDEDSLWSEAVGLDGLLASVYGDTDSEGPSRSNTPLYDINASVDLSAASYGSSASMDVSSESASPRRRRPSSGSASSRRRVRYRLGQGVYGTGGPNETPSPRALRRNRPLYEPPASGRSSGEGNTSQRLPSATGNGTNLSGNTSHRSSVKTSIPRAGRGKKGKLARRRKENVDQEVSVPTFNEKKSVGGGFRTKTHRDALQSSHGPSPQTITWRLQQKGRSARVQYAMVDELEPLSVVTTQGLHAPRESPWASRMKQRNRAGNTRRPASAVVL